MNEEVKYCDQCGVKISPDAKFCSSCGHDLINSSTKTTLDKTIKVEVTNATVEKGCRKIRKKHASGWNFHRSMKSSNSTVYSVTAKKFFEISLYEKSWSEYGNQSIQ